MNYIPLPEIYQCTGIIQIQTTAGIFHQQGTDPESKENWPGKESDGHVFEKTNYVDQLNR